MSECYLGSIVLWAGNFQPRNWMFCKGQLLNISGNEALYTVIGTMYGGDGQTTFALPNLVGRLPMGASQNIPLASLGGNVMASATGTALLTANNIPTHDHPNSSFSLTGIAATTTINVSTNTTDGQVIATQNALLAGTTPGNPTAAAIYLPSTATPLAPVHLGGVTTSATASVNATVSETIAGNAGTQTAMTLLGSAPAVPASLTLNYLICVSGLFPTRN